ncbi:hypothetical protein ACLI4R_03150 [Natrialbaceae archaeon A-chndr2]
MIGREVLARVNKRSGREPAFVVHDEPGEPGEGWRPRHTRREGATRPSGATNDRLE